MKIIMSTCCSLLTLCFSEANKKEEFVKQARTILQDVKNLRVDILPVLTFKDEKFGGYVAENYTVP